MRSPNQDQFIRRAAVAGTVALVLYGVALRVTCATTAVVWLDEMWTSMYATGHCLNPTLRELPQLAGPLSGLELQERFLRPAPGRGVWHDLRTSSACDPPNAPMHYLLVRLASALGAAPLLAGRAVSVLFSLLLLPAFAWLCFALFGSRVTPGAPSPPRWDGECWCSSCRCCCRGRGS